MKARETVELIDFPYGGRPSRRRWRKVRCACRNVNCNMISWTWDDTRSGFPRQALADRAARWVTVQVGRYGRSVSEVADELGCSWHTVNDAVMSYGEALIDDDPARVGTVSALGLDEALFRRGPPRRQHWSTSIVDVGGGRLLDVVEGRTGAGPSSWLARQAPAWRANIEWPTLDLSEEVNTLGWTLIRWRNQIAAWHHSRHTNGPTEAANNLLKRVAFGFTISAATESGCSSTPANPTGTYSPPALPAETWEASKAFVVQPATWAGPTSERRGMMRPCRQDAVLPASMGRRWPRHHVGGAPSHNTSA